MVSFDEKVNVLFQLAEYDNEKTFEENEVFRLSVYSLVLAASNYRNVEMELLHLINDGEIDSFDMPKYKAVLAKLEELIRVRKRFEIAQNDFFEEVDYLNSIREEEIIEEHKRAYNSRCRKRRFRRWKSRNKPAVKTRLGSNKDRIEWEHTCSPKYVLKADELRRQIENGIFEYEESKNIFMYDECEDF